MPNFSKQNKIQAPQPPNSFEKAIWQYATCSLSGPLPQPTTRTEQLAQAFVLDDSASTDIRKLKEINRCIGVCETYQRYQTNPDEFQPLPPLHVQVGFGKEPTSLSSPGEDVPSSAGSLEVANALPVAQAESNPPQSSTLPNEQNTLPELYINPASSVSAVLRYCYEVTKDDSFTQVPSTPNQVQTLLDKLRLANATFKNYSGPYGNKLPVVIGRLAAYRQELEGVESAQQYNSELDTFSFSRGAENDPAAGLRQEPPAAADYLQNLSSEQLWNNRLDIINKCDEKRARLLKDVYPKRTLNELKNFRKEIGPSISAWANIHIVEPLERAIEEKSAPLRGEQ